MFKNSIKYSLLALFALIALGSVSCNKWLNVSPKSDMNADDMFADEAGFRDNLIGVYVLMTSTHSYGTNLSYGFLDVLAQYYDSPKRPTASGGAHTYKYEVEFDYVSTNSQSRVTNIWARAYKAVANLNLGLEYIDKNAKVFMVPEIQKMYKGEYFALRALLHFDVLRMYAPSPKMLNGNGLSALAIPYIDIYTNKPQKQLTVAETLDKIIADLQTAKGLLAQSDPLGPATLNPAYLSYEQFANRKYRMNYCAVTALLARVYLYAGKTDLALAQAKEIIGEPTDDAIFPLATTAPTADAPFFDSELIFSINVTKQEKNIEGILTEVDLSASFLTMTDINYNKIFIGAAEDNDFRKVSFTKTTAGNSYLLNRYYKSTAIGFLPRIPMIKVSELYLIAAECAGGTTGLDYLNRLRAHRGCTPIVDATIFNKELYNEYRKEFIGEGQLFFFYKRNVYTKIGAADDIEITNAEKVYNLPIPLGELDYGNIKQ